MNDSLESDERKRKETTECLYWSLMNGWDIPKEIRKHCGFSEDYELYHRLESMEPEDYREGRLRGEIPDIVEVGARLTYAVEKVFERLRSPPPVQYLDKLYGELEKLGSFITNPKNIDSPFINCKRLSKYILYSSSSLLTLVTKKQYPMMQRRKHMMSRGKFISVLFRQQQNGSFIADSCENEGHSRSRFYFWKQKYGITEREPSTKASRLGVKDSFIPIVINDDTPSPSISHETPLPSPQPSAPFPLKGKDSSETSLELPNGLRLKFKGSSDYGAALNLISRIYDANVLPK